MYSILPIYTYGSDILRKKTKKIASIDDSLIKLIGDMFLTLHSASGVGLAAPQVGKDIALTVIDVSAAEEKKKIKTPPMVLINPVILDAYGESVMEEGCLSIPLLRAEVRRPSEVLIEFMDLNMNIRQIEMKSYLARVAQHEIDHLNGKLYIDYLDKEEKKKLKPVLEKIKKGLVETDYMLAETPSSKSQKKN
ncbi:MAG: peptide deformylase [Ignavibacteria bacterium]|nr:peptide deformylase [Ignavibacteria bacterium]